MYKDEFLGVTIPFGVCTLATFIIICIVNRNGQFNFLEYLVLALIFGDIISAVFLGIRDSDLFGFAWEIFLSGISTMVLAVECMSGNVIFGVIAIFQIMWAMLKIIAGGFVLGGVIIFVSVINPFKIIYYAVRMIFEKKVVVA